MSKNILETQKLKIGRKLNPINFNNVIFEKSEYDLNE